MISCYDDVDNYWYNSTVYDNTSKKSKKTIVKLANAICSKLTIKILKRDEKKQIGIKKIKFKTGYL